MDDKGFHYIVDMQVESKDLLVTPASLHTIFSGVLREFSILKYDFHKFAEGGEGVTGFFLLSESHCAYHTYPENNYIAIDVFTCGRRPTKLVETLAENLKASSYHVHYLRRGSTVATAARADSA